MRANQASSSGGSHWPWIGRSTAAFTAAALSARIAAPRSAPGGVPVVITMCLTPSSSTAALATSASCAGRLALDRAAGRERLADGAELAGLGAALVADAGLQHGRRQHVAAVQDGDLRIRNAVGGGAGRRSAGASESCTSAERHAVAADAAAAGGVRLLDDVGAFEGRRGMHRHHHGHAVDGDRLVVGRAGAAAAALVRRPWDQRAGPRRTATR